MQGDEADSAAVSEAPSSGSEESDCEPCPEAESDAAVTEEWARDLLAGTGVAGASEVLLFYLLLLVYVPTHSLIVLLSIA